MEVFLSWSGGKSRRLAKAFKEFLEDVIQAISPFFSPDDLKRGKRWVQELTHKLAGLSTGLVFITRENVNSPWILFEAGALAKDVARSTVTPVLFELEPADIPGSHPLASFNMTPFRRDEVLQLLRELNTDLEPPLPPDRLVKYFDQYWPGLEGKVAAVLAEPDPEPVPDARSQQEVVREVLERVRRLPELVAAEVPTFLIDAPAFQASIHQQPSVSHTSQGDVLVFVARFEGEASQETSLGFWAHLTGVLNSGPENVVLDLSGVSFVHPAAVDVLTSVGRAARVKRKQACLVPNEQLEAVIAVTGLGALYRLFPTLDAALRWIHDQNPGVDSYVLRRFGVAESPADG